MKKIIGASSHEIIPVAERMGTRTYVLMQPYVLEPNLTMSVELYDRPKEYADQESSVGRIVGRQKVEGFNEISLGSAQAWYYHSDRMIVLWECFFDNRFRRDPLQTDLNMQKLWQESENWLVRQFPTAKTIATPFNDPIAHSIKEYQTFLRASGYKPIAKAAYGKTLT